MGHEGSERRGGVARRGPRWALLAAAAALVVFWFGLILWLSSRGDPPLPVDEGLAGWLLALAVVAGLVSMFVIPALVVIGLFGPPPRCDDRVWRANMALYRSIAVLRRVAPEPKRAARALADLSVDGLRVAAVLPAHSAAGRAIALDALRARGAELDPVPDVVAPSFFDAESIADPEKSVFGPTTRVRTVAFVLCGVLFVAIFVAVGFSMAASDGLRKAARAEGVADAVMATFEDADAATIPDEVRHYPEAQAVIRWQTAGMVIAGLLIPAVAIYFLAAWLRPRPVRMLLLRKFNDRALGRAYKRLIAAELQPMGHVIALADRHVRRSTFGWIAGMIARAFGSIPAAVLAIVTIPTLLILRATDRTRWGPAYVAAPRDFRLLAMRLFDRFELNLETQLVSNAYLVRTSDDWWQIVIRMLMKSADVIVLDLSNVTQGTEWEIETITELGLWDRVVRIALDARQDDALAADAPAGPILLYDASGSMVGRADFRSAMFEALARSVLARDRALQEAGQRL